ncbi:MAG: SdpI family protein [Telluria sp.]
MKNRFLALSLLLVVAAFAATLMVYGRLPDQIPLHWNADGEIDRYGARASAFLMPAVMALLLVLLAVLPKVSPLRFSVDAFSDTYWYCALIVEGMLAYIQGLIMAGSLDHGIDTGRWMLAGMAIFIALLGNVMGKVRRNFWLGVRTPWTLANDRVWYATHRLAAKMMVGCSGLAFIAALANFRFAAVLLIVIGPLVPAVYSLLYYKRLERSGGLEA